MRHLRIYRAIQLINREGSIRKAAESLMISPSALNRSVLAFEEELGVDIFERLPSGVRLSVPGELLLRLSDEHLSRMDDYFSLISEMQGGQAGTLRLSVSGDLTETLLPDALRSFRNRHPGLGVEIEEGETAAGLLQRKVDLALVTWPQTEPEVEVALSQPAHIIGRVHAQHPQVGATLALSDLPDHRLLVPPIGSGLRVAIDQALRRFRLRPADLSVYPRLLPSLDLAPLAEMQIAVDWRSHCPTPPGLGLVDLSPLRLGRVQITALKRAEGSLPRPADLFLSALHRFLEAAA